MVRHPPLRRRGEGPPPSDTRRHPPDESPSGFTTHAGPPELARATEGPGSEPNNGCHTAADPDHPRPKPERTKAANDGIRLWLGAGTTLGVEAGDIVRCVLGETGLPEGTVSGVDVRDRHAFIRVPAEHVAVVLSRLNRAELGDDASRPRSPEPLQRP